MTISILWMFTGAGDEFEGEQEWTVLASPAAASVFWPGPPSSDRSATVQLVSPSPVTWRETGR